MSAESEHPEQRRDDESFVVRDEASANWVVRKIVEARQYRERVKGWAEFEITRSRRDEERLLYLYGGQLEAWAKLEIERRGRRTRSLNLPAGRVGFRKRRPKITIEDPAAVLVWAKAACPEAVVIVQRISRAKIEDHLCATGELPPAGIHIDGGDNRFFIT